MALLALSFGLRVWIGDSADFFTSDKATQAILSKILAIIILAQPLNSIVFAADGVLQGASKFSYQAKAMALSGATAWISFIMLQEASGAAESLLHVWIGLVVLQFMRGITSFVVKIVEKDGPIDLLLE